MITLNRPVFFGGGKAHRNHIFQNARSYTLTAPAFEFSMPPASSHDVPSEEISRQGLIGCAACGRKPQLTDTEIRVRTRMAHRSIRSPRNISKAVNTKEAVHDSDSLLYFPSQERRHGTPEG